MNSPNHLWFWQNRDLLQGSYFFGSLKKKHWISRALNCPDSRNNKKTSGSPRFTANVSTHDCLQPVQRGKLYVLTVSMHNTCGSHSDAPGYFPHIPTPWAHGRLWYWIWPKSVTNSTSWKPRTFTKLTTTESNFSNLTPSRSLVITHLEMFLLRFVEVVILNYFCCESSLNILRSVSSIDPICKIRV